MKCGSAQVTWIWFAASGEKRPNEMEPRSAVHPSSRQHTASHCNKQATVGAFSILAMSYDGSLLRLLVNLMANMALLLAFIQAPSLHIHPHEDQEHQAATLCHLHLEHVDQHSESLPEGQDLDPDDHSQSMDWFSTTPRTSSSIPVAAILVSVSPSPILLNAKRFVAFQPSGNDPPDLTATRPRAPPLL